MDAIPWIAAGKFMFTRYIDLTQSLGLEVKPVDDFLGTLINDDLD